MFTWNTDYMEVFNNNMDHMNVFMHNTNQLKASNDSMDKMEVFVHNKDDLKVSLNGWMKSLFIRLLLAISENKSKNIKQ